MALAVLGPLNGVINKTTKEILDNEIPGRVAKVFGTFVTASVEAVNSVLQSVLELTKEQSGGTP